jgi:hypothetical protein
MPVFTFLSIILGTRDTCSIPAISVAAEAL